MWVEVIACVEAAFSSVWIGWSPSEPGCAEIGCGLSFLCSPSWGKYYSINLQCPPLTYVFSISDTLITIRRWSSLAPGDSYRQPLEGCSPVHFVQALFSASQSTIMWNSPLPCHVHLLPLILLSLWRWTETVNQNKSFVQEIAAWVGLEGWVCPYLEMGLGFVPLFFPGETKIKIT